MSALIPKIRTYAELGRTSNLPTTFTNVLVGMAIALDPKQATLTADPMLFVRIATVWLAIACFYIAGMAMNDLLDADIDQRERPHRPIPSGRISRNAARRFAIITIMLGLALLALMGVPAFVGGLSLVVLIVGYNMLHRITAASVVLMGLARAMIYVIAALAFGGDSIDWELLQPFGFGLAVYVAGFSLVARREMQPHVGGMKFAGELAVFAAILPPFFVPPEYWNAVLLPLVLAVAWLSRGVGMVFATPPSTKQAVMIWISGICLVDSLYLITLDHFAWAVIAQMCFLMCTIAQRRSEGT